MGDGPARRAGDEAQPLLPVQAVDLINHPVDVVGQARAGRADLAIDPEQALGVLHPARAIVGDEAPGLEVGQGLALGLGELRAGLAPGVGEELQRPPGGDGGIDLAQRAGGEVAGVGVGALARFHGGSVEGLELGQRRIDLAADFDDVGPALAVQSLGDVLQGAQVGGDVLAGAAVAPGGASDQHALLVTDRGGQAVDLRLGGEGHGLAGLQLQETPHAGHELDHVGSLEGVVEAQHRHAMHDRRELGRARRAHLQRRAVVAHQPREARFDRRVAPLQRVVVAIADRGFVFLVIANVVAGDLVGQPRQLLGGLGLAQVFDGLGFLSHDAGITFFSRREKKGPASRAGDAGR